MDDKRIMTDVARGRHLVVLGPPRRGNGLRVAALVHRRWAPFLTASSCAARTVSATLATPRMSLQILSCHLPSHLNLDAEGFEHHVREMGSLMAGVRRHRLLIGVDANFQLDAKFREHNIVGGAIKSNHGRGTSPKEQENIATFLNEVAAHNFYMMNTFASFWTAPGMERGCDRFTWEGTHYGKRIGEDDRPRHDARRHSRPPFFNDEKLFDAIPQRPRHDGMSIDLKMSLGLPTRVRPVQKNIGRWPNHAEQYDAEVGRALPSHMAPISKITEALSAAASALGPTSETKPRRGVSGSVEGLRARTRAASTSAQERQALVEKMWSFRHIIEHDKIVSSASMGRMRTAWSKQISCHDALFKRAGQIPCSRLARDRIKGPLVLYRTFSRPEAEFRPHDDRLSEEANVGRTMQLTPGTSLEVEDIRAAIISMKRWKTCGDDGVVPEMVIAKEQADWHWASAFNQRIANLEGDPTKVVRDTTWDHFRVRLLPKSNSPVWSRLLRPSSILKASARLYSRCFFMVLEKCGHIPQPAHMGFKAHTPVRNWLP